MAAFVLGNGVSRATIDVDRLIALGPVYGCNALYRTHAVTALVATDRPIAEAIQASGYSLENRFYTRRPQPNTGAQVVPRPYFGYSSGPIALALAAAENQGGRVYMLGFDLGPNQQGRFNNLFADTEHYKRSEAGPTFTGNWIRQLVKVMQDHPHCQFVRVHGVTTAPVQEFEPVRNLEWIQIPEFERRINTPKDL
jgi:hypothetical protein